MVYNIIKLTDVDECVMQPQICGFGECYNTIGSFNCRCEEGYSVKPAEGPACTDDDECRLNAYSCSEFAECQNTQGSYICTCHDGFTGNGIECWDINECSTNNGGCDSNAHCINTEGSFKVYILKISAYCGLLLNYKNVCMTCQI